MPEWLERELTAHLSPAEAPEALAGRVLAGRARLAAVRISPLWIAAAMVVLSAGTLWLSARPPAPVSNARWSASARVQINDHNCVLCHTL